MVTITLPVKSYLAKYMFYDFVRMNKYRRGIQYKTSVLLFMEKYGIQEEELSAEALMKSFQRWRKKVKEETADI